MDCGKDFCIGDLIYEWDTLGKKDWFWDGMDGMIKIDYRVAAYLGRYGGSALLPNFSFVPVGLLRGRRRGLELRAERSRRMNE